MALSPNDILPTGITINKAYTEVKKWYVNNLPLLYTKMSNKDYIQHSADLINYLSQSSKINKVEKKAILCEILNGYLEWGYNESDLKFKMAAYAIAALNPEKKPLGTCLDKEELLELSTNEIWPYLMRSKK